MSLLEVQDIHTYYGDSYILQGVHLNVERGTLTAVVGRNGVGKTTLIRSIMGLNPPVRARSYTKGRILAASRPSESSEGGLPLSPRGDRSFHP